VSTKHTVIIGEQGRGLMLTVEEQEFEDYPESYWLKGSVDFGTDAHRISMHVDMIAVDELPDENGFIVPTPKIRDFKTEFMAYEAMSGDGYPTLLEFNGLKYLVLIYPYAD
jgi:hypothetical protein